MDLIKNQMLEYLFDEDTKEIKRWNNNKSVELSSKWNFMLGYPYDFNKYKNSKTTILELSTIIIQLLEKKY